MVTVTLLVIVILGLSWWTLRGRDDSDGGGSGPGRGGPHQRRPPDDGPAGGEFPWWPEFERQFAEYVNPSDDARPRPTKRRSSSE